MSQSPGPVHRTTTVAPLGAGVPPCEESLAAYFAAAHGAALEAQAVAGAVVVPLEIAGARIDLVFAGTRLLIELMPALRRFDTRSRASADTTVHAWDRHTTGVTLSPPPRGGAAAGGGERSLHVDGARFRAAILAAEGPASVMDLQSGEAVFWVDRAERLRRATPDSPLLTLVHWGLERSSGQTMDASAVRTLLEGGARNAPR